MIQRAADQKDRGPEGKLAENKTRHSKNCEEHARESLITLTAWTQEVQRCAHFEIFSQFIIAKKRRRDC